MLQRRYGTATTVYFPLIDFGATDFLTGASAASGDIKISKDGGAFANTATATFTEEGNGWYSVPLTATEMQARVISISVIDQTNPKEWEDQGILIETVNHASAEIPVLEANVASVDTDAIDASAIADGAITAAKIASSAITSAKFASGAIDASAIASNAITAAKIASDAITAAKIAANAIGASELAADAVTEIQSGLATAAALDAVDNYVDTEVAAIKAKTDNLPTDPADASDIAALLATISGYIDTEVAAIKAKTDLIPASPAAVSDIPTAIENADALLKRDIDSVETTAPVHSLASAILKLVSRFVASTGVTYRTDGTTTHMTQTPTTDANADPVTELGAAS